MNHQTSGLSLETVSISIESRPLLSNFSLHIRSGEVVSIMGPSGVGKSSLLAFVSGSLRPPFQASGRIDLNGRQLVDLPIEQRRVGVIYQDDLLFAHLTVAENLAFALPSKIARQERQERVKAALVDAELPDFGPRDPATLSGGQRARISLMRALLAEPEALLLDEPFSKLDPALRDRMRAFTFERISARALPVLLVTHDPADVAGRLITLS